MTFIKICSIEILHNTSQSLGEYFVVAVLSWQSRFTCGGLGYTQRVHGIHHGPLHGHEHAPDLHSCLILILIPPELRNVTQLPRCLVYSSNLNPSHLSWTTSSLATPAGGWRDG